MGYDHIDATISVTRAQKSDNVLYYGFHGRFLHLISCVARSSGRERGRTGSGGWTLDREH